MPESGRHRNAQRRFLGRSCDEKLSELPWQIVSAPRKPANQAALYQTAVVRTRATEFAEPLRDAAERLFRAKKGRKLFAFPFISFSRINVFRNLSANLATPSPFFPPEERNAECFGRRALCFENRYGTDLGGLQEIVAPPAAPTRSPSVHSRPDEVYRTWGGDHREGAAHRPMAGAATTGCS